MNTTTAPSVLIVEDERIVAKDLRDMVAELGYRTLGIASSADEAIAQASRCCPDVVLMDIRIKGGRDGIEAAEILIGRFDVSVVYVTAHADEATLGRAKMTKPFAYLIKPVSSQALHSAIEIALYRHDMERQLRERERWFSTMVRSIVDAIVAVDLSGNITFINPAAEFLLGKKLEDVAGLPARDVLRLLPLPPSEALEPPLDRALRERREVQMSEEMLVADDSSTRTISDSAAPVLDEDQLLGAVMVLRDISEQKRLQSHLELSDRLASLGTLAAGVAHEINNPLAVVMASASLVLDELKEARDALIGSGSGAGVERIPRIDSMVDVLTEATTSARRIANIVRDLVAFARPTRQSGGPTDVHRAVGWAVRTTSHALRDRARVVADVGDVPPVRMDEVRLGQVLVSLLVNAAHAIAPGDVARNEVSVRAREGEQGSVVIEVRDSGSGMSPEVQKRVFEPFFTTKDIGVGTGVGLSIARGMVCAAGGDIEVESKVGTGSLFRVVLPTAASDTTTPPTRASP